MINDRRRLKLIFSLFMISLSIFCLIFSAIYASKPASSALSSTVAAPVSFTQEPISYVLCERNGEIVVFSSADMETPYICTGILTAGLREVDRESIQNGISVSDISKVWQLIEDLGS